MWVERAGTAHPDPRYCIEQRADDKHTQRFRRLQYILRAGVIEERVGRGADLNVVERGED